MTGMFKRWADDYVRHLRQNPPPPPLSPVHSRTEPEDAPKESAPEPDHAEEKTDATPRQELTVGELTLNHRGMAVEVRAHGLTVRGTLQDFRAEGFTDWDGGRGPDILPGPVTLDIMGAREYTAAIVTCWHTDPITIMSRRK